MNPTGQYTQTRHIATGLVAFLRGLLRARGSGLSKTTRTGAHPRARSLLVALGALLAVAALVPALASAAVVHEFLPGPSKKLGEGVPHESGAKLTGPLILEGSVLAVDSGHLWVEDQAPEHEGVVRIDKFDHLTGAFLAPQLDEEAGFSFQQETSFAAGHANGEETVYVPGYKEGKSVVGVLDGETGKLLDAWTGAHTANGSFTQSIAGVAVDGDPEGLTDPASGDVYVATTEVNVFKPQAGGGEPSNVAAPPLTGTCASPGVCPGAAIPFTRLRALAVSGFNGDLLVADQTANGFVVDIFEPRLGEYAFVRQLTGTPTGPGGAEVPFGLVKSLAVDALTGEIYVADGTSHVVDEFDREGNYLGRLTGTPTGPFNRLQGVAVDPESEHVFVAESNEETGTSQLAVFGAPEVVPGVETGAPTQVEPTGVTLNGKVTLAGPGVATCDFVWGTTKAFGHTTPCPAKLTAAETTVQVPLEKLTPDTEYCYRLQASSEAGALNPGEESQDQCFTTTGPNVPEESASDISAEAATLDATIDPTSNPPGTPTSYYFQYGTSTAYGSQVPLAPGEALVAAGEVSRHIQGLLPGTTYHYRAVAVSRIEIAPDRFETEFPGPDMTFTTQPAGSSLVLPDGREWEQVSPVDKHGGEPTALGTGLVQAAASGNAIAYETLHPTESDPQAAPGSIQVLSTRGTGGWSSRDINPPQATTSFASQQGGEYKYFSADLSLGLLEPEGNFTSLSPEASPPDTEFTPYLHHDLTCVTSPASCYEPLVTGAPGYADVPAGTKFGPGPTSTAPKPTFIAGTEDLAHAVLASTVALTPIETGKAGGQRGELYEWSAGTSPAEELQMVSLLPPNSERKELPAPGGLRLGADVFDGSRTGRAISSDGSRVIWTDELGGTDVHLYMRDTAQGKTVQLDLPEPECLKKGECGTGTPVPAFQAASDDGSRVFFTDTQALTKDAGAGGAGGTGRSDLYACEIVEADGGLECRLSDLTPRTSSGEAAEVQGGVLGASEDGSYVYFVADGVLGDGGERGATPGDCHEAASGRTCNLYVAHDDAGRWTTVFIASLSSDDRADWSLNPRDQTARVSPNGDWLAFMSDRSLTGYDNEDVTSVHAGERPDEEVYLYRVATGNLVCASCDPTGARPEGIQAENLGQLGATLGATWPPKQWLAAEISEGTGYEQRTSLYQSRFLSNGGRLFFNSHDALAPQDINHTEDVYEYEPVDTAPSPPPDDSCTAAGAGFVPAGQGCVSLISAGTGAGESVFIDASESGDDVFFLTADKLVPQDTDTSVDVYDAHVCGAEGVPCTPAVVAPPPCVNAEACRAAPAPQPAIFGAPASATFSGQGNLAPPSPAKPVVKKKTVKCPKGKTRNKHGKCVRKPKSKKRTKAKKTDRRAK